MNPILPDNERTDFEDRTYVNPNLTVDFTNQFIDNYRNLQKQNNAEIATQTRNLGTAVPSNLGGLVGAGSYFTSRYQTPQTNQTLQNLRTAAQADALKTALANEKAMWQKRYQDAYRAYQKRQNDKTNTTIDTPEVTGGTENVDPANKIIEGVTPGIPEGYTVANIDTEKGTVLGYTGVPYGEEGKTNYLYQFQDDSKNPENYTGLDWDTAAHVKTGLMEDGHFTTQYTLPSGKTVNVQRGAGGETLVRGKEGGYYIHNSKNNTYQYVGE